jgi:hypothetical protein
MFLGRVGTQKLFLSTTDLSELLSTHSLNPAIPVYLCWKSHPLHSKEFDGAAAAAFRFSGMIAPDCLSGVSFSIRASHKPANASCRSITGRSRRNRPGRYLRRASPTPAFASSNDSLAHCSRAFAPGSMWSDVIMVSRRLTYSCSRRPACLIRSVSQASAIGERVERLVHVAHEMNQELQFRLNQGLKWADR